MGGQSFVPAPLLGEEPGRSRLSRPRVLNPPQRFAWWRSEPYQKNLGLSTDQVNRLEAIFQTVLPALCARAWHDSKRHEAELSRLIESSADETLVTRQIDKVEAIRSRLNKTRQLLLLHHRQVLTPEQRVKPRRPNANGPGGPPNAQKP